MEVLVTYDIATADRAGERRLARVAKICESYGLRVQYSVFECRLSRTKLEQLAVLLEDEIDPVTDSVHIYGFPGVLENSRRTIGRSPARTVLEPWVV